MCIYEREVAMNKTSKIVLVLVINLFAIILSNYLVYNCDLFLTTSKMVDRINNNNYDISFDLDNKKIVIDGVSKDITDALKLSNEELDNLINNNEIESFINDNFIGDITNEDGKISIKNPYSTKKLIIKVKDKSILEKDDNIKEYKELTKDLYILQIIREELAKIPESRTTGRNIFLQRDLISIDISLHRNQVKGYTASLHMFDTIHRPLSRIIRKPGSIL